LPIVKDLTRDSIDEIIYTDLAVFPATHIFSCQKGAFLDFVPVDPALDAWPIYLTDILDLNANGMPELLFDKGFLGIYEWNGQEFKEISSPPNSFIKYIVGELDISYRDIDRNSTTEIIIERGDPGPLWAVIGETPWRSYTLIYTWNGQYFVQSSKEFDPPEYRFQAVQDADAYTRKKKFDNALFWYQEAIFSDEFDWWSAEKKDYTVAYEFYSRDVLSNSVDPSVTPPPSPEIDTTEYLRLAAYAYYRIMLLHIVQGYEADAGTVYNTLQQKFRDDPYGRPYVEMATGFWDAYQSSHKMYEGCAAAIQYASEHSEILTPLGSDYHGLQSHVYMPADVCPFR